jgi:hypothetical protein
MGTSNSFGGASGSKPLIPSWVDDSPAAPTAPGVAPSLLSVDSDAPSGPGGSGSRPTAPNPSTPSHQVPIPASNPAPAVAPSSSRFTAPRTQLSRFATSGGADKRALRRALSTYVTKSMGGSGTAARPMSSARRSGATLASFLADAQQNGLRETLRAIDLEALAGRSIQELFIGLVDYVCPDGGSLDDAIARDAFIETVADLSNEDFDLDRLTADQVSTVLERYVAHAIEARICNDIGTKLISLPASPAAALEVQEQVNDYIRRAASDAIARAGGAKPGITAEQMNGFMTDIYRDAFEILKSQGEE